MLRLILCMLTLVSAFGSEWYWPQEYKDTNIPILWMTTSDVNTIPQYMFDTWQLYTRGFDVRIYNDTQARAELVRQGSSRVLDLFDRLRPPHKYDLWRVCMLWRHGGFYMDIKTVLKRPLSSIFDPEKLLMTHGHRGDQGVHLGFMGGPARHTVFLKWIFNVLKRGFPNGEWYHVYCRMMESEIINHTGYVRLRESNVSDVGCVSDRYGLCCRIYDEQERVVARTRDPKYPWRTDAGVVNQLDDMNGEYFTLRRGEMKTSAKAEPKLPESMQLAPNQVAAILEVLPPDGNMLVWGVGHDSSFWQNQTTGRTVFLEDHPVWFSKIKAGYPELEMYRVSYDTKVSQWKYHLSHLNQTDIRNQLPSSVVSQHWDVILVDAPCGWKNECPGRFSSIYTSKNLDADHVFIDDVERQVEKVVTETVFGTPLNIYKNTKRWTEMALAKHKEMIQTLEPTTVNYLSMDTFPLNPNARRVLAKCEDIEYEMFVHDPTDCIYLSSELYFNGQWECNSVNEIVQTLRKSPHGNRTTFLDIGANIGSYTIPIAKSGFRVIGFEPMQYNHELLAASIGTYNLSNMVDIYPTAVSNSTSTVCLATTSAQHGNGQVVECNRAETNGWNYQRIYTGMIDDILSNHDLCYTVVKADVEGFELQAFKGAIQKVFQSHCPPEMVLFEHHMDTISTKVPTKAPIFKFMTRMGYQCTRFSLTDFKCVPIGKTLKPYNMAYFINMWEKKEKSLRVKRLKVDALRRDKANIKSIPHKMHFIWMQKNLLTDTLTSQTERANAENIRAIADTNPEYHVHIYDDTTCQRECRQTGIEGVPELYEDMRGATSFGPSSWASMSDVCRMAVLYNHGGVYMDTNMAMRLPFNEWLREDVSFVAPMSVCKHKRDLFNSFLGASPGHNATRLALERMVRDWDGHTFRALATHYSKDELNDDPFCYRQMGTIYSFLGWNATNREDTQLLDERIHFENTFKDVPRRALLKDRWYTLCNTIVVDPESGVVPFYSHMLKRANCSMKD